MKIDPTKITDLYESYAKLNASSNNSVSQNNELYKDRVEISDMGIETCDIAPMKSKIVSEIENGAEEQRLQELKQAIKDGTYHVSSEKIAEAMLNASTKEDD
jgi:anti-sigma28 factor (negative regulator of flagellin synthesis)